MVSNTVQQMNYLNTLDQIEFTNKIQLYQPYEAEQILLAENASCLSVKTYLKFIQKDFEIISVANAEFMAPGKRTKLPVVRIAGFLAAEFEPIINVMEHKKMSLTENFSQEDKDDLKTYMSLVESILTNAELYISWMDEKVLKEVTYERNGSVYPFPLNHFQNWRKRNNVLKQLEFYEWKDLTIEKVVDKVDELCRSLSRKLENKQFFYGNDNPSELDALVFGHLFCIFTMQLPTTVLSETINKYKNLTEFCFNIEKKYFDKSGNNRAVELNKIVIKFSHENF